VKIVLRLVLGLVVLAVVAVGAVAVLAQQKPSVGRDLRPVTASEAAARSFDDKIDQLAKAAGEAKRTGKAVPVEVSLTEEELTSKVSSLTSQPNPLGIVGTNTQVHLQGGNVIATSDVTVQGIQLSIGVVAQPTIVNGTTQIIVKEIQTGALPLPDAIKQQLNAQIGQAVDPTKLGLPIDVSKLQVVDGKLVIGAPRSRSPRSGGRRLGCLDEHDRGPAVRRSALRPPRRA